MPDRRGETPTYVAVAATTLNPLAGSPGGADRVRAD
jgi:hypothetical protein